MSGTTDQTGQFELQMPASWTRIAGVISAMNRFLACYDLDESFLAKSRVVLREMLSNAVKHSNKKSHEQPIFVDAAYLDNNRLRISVRDPGDGFDHRFFGLNKPDAANGMKGRGSYLIRTLSISIEFNESGNHITVYLSV